jgi:hypothetical protein
MGCALLLALVSGLPGGGAPGTKPTENTGTGAAPYTPAKPQRFLDHGDYVEDIETGLLWQKDGAASGLLNFYEAAKYAAKLKLGKLSGWRVPTRDELKAIFPATEAPFRNTKYNDNEYGKGKGPQEWHSYWTCEFDSRLNDYAYLYHWYGKGGANNCYASANRVYVRCVHDPIKKK